MKMPTTIISPESDLPKPPRVECKSQPVPRFDSRHLFGDGKSVHIEHEGKVYELRVTRLGKLILTA
jgi:hemin uptake protein HemP